MLSDDQNQIRSEMIRRGRALGIEDVHVILHSGCEPVPVIGVSLFIEGCHIYGKPPEVIDALDAAASPAQLLQICRERNLIRPDDV